MSMVQEHFPPDRALLYSGIGDGCPTSGSAQGDARTRNRRGQGEIAADSGQSLDEDPIWRKNGPLRPIEGGMSPSDLRGALELRM